MKKITWCFCEFWELKIYEYSQEPIKFDGLLVFCITAPNIHFCDAQTTEDISSFDPKGKFNFLEIISDSSTTKTNVIEDISWKIM